MGASSSSKIVKAAEYFFLSECGRLLLAEKKVPPLKKILLQLLDLCGDEGTVLLRIIHFYHRYPLSSRKKSKSDFLCVKCLGILMKLHNE